MFKQTVLSTAVALIVSLPAYANDIGKEVEQVKESVEKMELKVQNLDSKLDQILALLAQQPVSPPAALATVEDEGIESIASLSTENSAEVIDDEMAKLIVLNSANEPKNNGLLMDVYVLDKEGEELPDKPTGFPIATLDYNKGAAFTFADHLKDKDVYSVAFNKTLGLNYHGYIKITEPGKYVLSQYYESIYSGVKYDKPGQCVSTATIEGKTILKVKGENGLAISQSDQTMLQLSPGYKKIEVWFTCTPTKSEYKRITERTVKTYNNTLTNIRIKGPSDRKMMVIKPDSLFYK